MLKYFRSSIWISIIGLLLSAFVGWEYSQTLQGALQALFLAFVLSILEVSISFDNAVVNATVLKKMTPEWQHRFITWGMLIAVFGMRILFPLLVVSVATSISPWAALKLATFSPQEYSLIMHQAHVPVSAFGGAFLMMVALKYFFDTSKEIHWIYRIEAPLAKLGKIEALEIGLVLINILVFMKLLPDHDKIPFVLASISGLITYIAVDGLGGFLSLSEEGTAHAAGDETSVNLQNSKNSQESRLSQTSTSSQNSKVSHDIQKTSAMLFVYLEVLDASFSFDGVIGSFAITNNLFIIAIGLGIGAMFVRSLTILFVEKNTLSEFRYLEHGAFYAIWALATIMFVNTIVEIPEVITGIFGAAFIGLSLHSSIKERRA